MRNVIVALERINDGYINLKDIYLIIEILNGTIYLAQVYKIRKEPMSSMADIYFVDYFTQKPFSRPVSINYKMMEYEVIKDKKAIMLEPQLHLMKFENINMAIIFIKQAMLSQYLSRQYILLKQNTNFSKTYKRLITQLKGMYKKLINI